MSGTNASNSMLKIYAAGWEPGKFLPITLEAMLVSGTLTDSFLPPEYTEVPLSALITERNRLLKELNELEKQRNDSTIKLNNIVSRINDVMQQIDEAESVDDTRRLDTLKNELQMLTMEKDSEENNFSQLDTSIKSGNAQLEKIRNDIETITEKILGEQGDAPILIPLELPYDAMEKAIEYMNMEAEFRKKFFEYGVNIDDVDINANYPQNTDDKFMRLASMWAQRVIAFIRKIDPDDAQTHDTMYTLINIANFLNIPLLLKFLVKRTADLLRGRTTDEITAIFGNWIPDESDDADTAGPSNSR